MLLSSAYPLETNQQKRDNWRMVGSPHHPQTRARVIQEFLACGRIDLACQRVGVDRGCHYDWLKADPGYAAEFASARKQTADILEDEAWRRAVEGVDKPVYQGGELVGTVREYSDSLMTWLLRGLRPERYREHVDVTTHDGDLAARIQAAQERRRLRQAEAVEITGGLVEEGKDGVD